MILLQQHILKVLSYFNIFHYPLLPEEIKEYTGMPASMAEITVALQLLEQENRIYKLEEFYTLQDDIFFVIRRRNGNRAAAAEMEKAKKAAALLFKFPFVEGLAISGSLSKNYADENTDIDFFIITAPNRLWIARTWMHVFYKWAAFTGRKRLFCMNYYIDESALEIAEKNIFTAMEIVTLIPVAGHQTISGFLNANSWTQNYFPNRPPLSAVPAAAKKWWLRKIVEGLLSGKWGNAIDNWLLKITRKHWQQKKQQAKTNSKGISTGMLANKHYSKPDPKNFQQKILVQYENRTAALNNNQYTAETFFTALSSSAVK